VSRSRSSSLLVDGDGKNPPTMSIPSDGVMLLVAAPALSPEPKVALWQLPIRQTARSATVPEWDSV